MKPTIRFWNGLLCLGLLLLLFGGTQLSAKTLYVGSCVNPGGFYPSIQQAINAAPVGAKVQVCPGSYLEQIKITRAMTLQGISNNSGDTVFLSPPPGGLVADATNAFGMPVGAVVLVENAAGPVNISGIYVFGGNNNTAMDIAGIFYQNSAGTINGVTVDHFYNEGSGFGAGVWLEGGPARPSVTVENTLLLTSSYAAVFVGTSGQSNTALTAKITNNSVWMPKISNATGILLTSGATASITGNLVNGAGTGYGFWVGPGAAGSVSDNNVSETQIGVETYADEVSVSSNQLSVMFSKGIDLQTAFGIIKGNLILQPQIGIEFNCIANLNVRSNTINDAAHGLDQIPPGVNPYANKLFVVGIAATGC